MVEELTREKKKNRFKFMYKPTIGLEIHTELKTHTKMFCDCFNDPDEKHPNINVCPICLAHPGVLPTINKKAVEAVLKLGLALNSKIPETSKFDRKNYFYPDLPKGYQISQYDKPLCVGGYLEINAGTSDVPNINNVNNRTSDVQKLNKIRITRIHLEEDTGRLIHSPDGKSSLVDFNRAGIPLMELVTEPDIKTGKQAVDFAKELQLILRYLEISDADMEKGQMRVEVNISLRENTDEHGLENGLAQMGTKVEIKNLNSFRAVGESIDYEIERQNEILEKGEKIKQETRGWDDIKKRTVSQRSKEEAHDYRYFPEPDLPPIDLTTSQVVNLLENLKIEIPELPAQKRKRFIREYNLGTEQVEILVDDRYLAEYFEESVSELDADQRGLDTDSRRKKIQLLFNYLTSDTKGLINEQKISIKELNITPENFADLIVLISSAEISSRSAKDILKEMAESGLDPRQIIEQKGLKQVSDEGELTATIEQIIKENPKAVEDYKKGKSNALQFMIGKSMAKLKGKGNPDILRKLFGDYLSK